jgi:hypothetical protein
MTQLIENTPPRRALIATLSHFCASRRRFVASGILFGVGASHNKSVLSLTSTCADSLAQPPAVPPRAVFLIDRGCRLETDVTPAQSSKTPFLIVAESTFRNSAFFVFPEGALFGSNLKIESAGVCDRSSGESELNQFEKGE